MKEHIYSIPLTEALEEKCGCILCILEKKLEQQAISYFLGPSLMEPDGRSITNEKGFCRRHMGMLFEQKNRLGLALTLETHIKEIEDKLKIKKKQGMFSKESTAMLTSQNLYGITKSCALCDKMNSQIFAAAGNIAYLWDSNEDFRKMFEESQGLCLEHMALAIEACDKELSEKKKEKYINMLIEKQKNLLAQIYENLHTFTLSFDYRNAGKELSKAEKESVQTAVKHLTKY
ncbi:MAG: hypothetical protein IJZ81_02660 [Clostridia bacterium]|nr:hypothetical protein [Clostridia bacterium]